MNGHFCLRLQRGHAVFGFSHLGRFERCSFVERSHWCLPGTQALRHLAVERTEGGANLG